MPSPPPLLDSKGQAVTRPSLGRGAIVDDVGNVAAVAASDLARTITALTSNIAYGSIIT
jgi:hypothetical protein